MMMLKEQWLIVTQKYKIITGDFKAKIGTETKKKKTSKAWQHLE